MSADAEVIALRDRTRRLERRRKREKASRIVRFALAIGSVVGVSVGVTTAAWVQQIDFTAQTTIEAFQMQYSFDNKTFTEFPESKTVTLTNWTNWADGSTGTQTHYLFVKNIGAKATQLTLGYVVEDVFTEPGVVTVARGWDTVADADLTTMVSGGVLDLMLPQRTTLKLRITFEPGKLQPSAVERTGSFELTVTGSTDLKAQADPEASMSPDSSERAAPTASRRESDAVS